MPRLMRRSFFDTLYKQCPPGRANCYEDLLQAFLNSDSQVNGHADHGVAAVLRCLLIPLCVLSASVETFVHELRRKSS